MKYILVFCLLLTLLAACASTPRRAPMNVSAFTLFSTFSFPEAVSKAHYNPGTQTVYAVSPMSHEIYLWREGKRINVIGGLGLNAANFQQLGDIAVANDGSLYAVDTMARNLKKFTSDGKLLGTMELKGTIQPQKLAVGTEQNLYVWDASSAEIISYNMLDGTELFRFGRFQIERVDLLFASRDYVVAYDQSRDQSKVFSSLGQLISTEPGQILYDSFNNAINLTTEALLSKMSAAFLPMLGAKSVMTVSRDILAMVVGTELRLLKIEYEQNP